MIKLETHCHTIGVSSCGDTDNKTLIKKYIDAKYNGIIVTNHFCKNHYFEFLQGKTHTQKVDYFFKVYDDFSKECAVKSIKTFWGAEVRVIDPRNERGTEYTVIGLPRSAFYQGDLLFELNQKELFMLCEKHGAFMYQTHPFRRAVCVGNPKFMHGAEFYNGHYNHENNNHLAQKFCEENNLIKLSGTDFHHADQPVTAGIYIPDNITNEKELVKCLFDRNYQMIFNGDE